MVLVIAAAALMASLFMLFKVFDRREIPLMPAISVNYLVALAFGTLYAPPWQAGDIANLWIPAIGIGILFLLIFYLTGLSAQRAGLAATTVASRMSLVLTVIAAVVLYGDRPGWIGWLGIVAALVGVTLSSLVKGSGGVRGAWLLPLLIFLGNAVIDISVNWMQRMHLTPATEAVFPALCFISAALLSVVHVALRDGFATFTDPGVLIGGGLLGVLNYAALLMIVRALAYSGLPSSSVYPLMNVCVIMFATVASIFLFGERLRKAQWIGIGFAVLALVLILNA